MADDTKAEVIELDLTHVSGKAHVIIRLKDDQPKPKLLYVWIRYCYYCGKKFERFRFPRQDRHHQCSKRCTDKTRNRGKVKRRAAHAMSETPKLGI